MNSEKAAAKRKPEANNGGCTGVTSNEETIPIAQPSTSEESPNHLLYKKVSLLNLIIIQYYFIEQIKF